MYFDKTSARQGILDLSPIATFPSPPAVPAGAEQVPPLVHVVILISLLTIPTLLVTQMSGCPHRKVRRDVPLYSRIIYIDTPGFTCCNTFMC